MPTIKKIILDEPKNVIHNNFHHFFVEKYVKTEREKSENWLLQKREILCEMNFKNRLWSFMMESNAKK